jgi:hypothetical protein
VTGTPADVGPGVVVRVRLGGGLGYASPRMSLPEAIQTAARFRSLVNDARRQRVAFVEFVAEGIEDLSLIAEEIKAVEVRRVPLDGHVDARPADQVDELVADLVGVNGTATRP